MRVVRLEMQRNPDSTFARSTKTLRSDMLGAFQNMSSLPSGIGSFIPSPYDDREFYPTYDHSDALFFAFPSFDFFVNEILERFPYCIQYVWNGERKGYHPDLVLAEYEVSPTYKSKYQVVFYGETAKFISEIKLADLCS